MTRARQLIAAVVFGVLLLAVGARATSDTTLSFQDLSVGTVVTDQYASEGIHFGHRSDLGAPALGTSDCGPPEVANDPRSKFGNQVGEAPICAGAEFGFSGTIAAFSYPRSRVRVVVDTTLPGTGVDVRIFAGDGQLLDQRSSQSTLQTAFSFFAPNGNIAFLTLQTTLANNARLLFDNLEFDNDGAPLSATGTTFGATAGVPATPVVAHLTDADPTATAADFSASIDWGDHSAPTTGAVTAASGGYDVTGSHTYASAGSYTVGVSVSKVNGRTTSATGRAKVAAGAPAPDFQVSALPSEQTVKQGQSATYTVRVDTIGSFSGNVVLSLAGASGSFSPATVAAPGSSTLTVTTSAQTAPGTYKLTVTATAAGRIRAATVQLNVTAAPRPPLPQPPRGFDLRANGIEVTQGIQSRDSFFRGGELPSYYRADGTEAYPIGAPVHYIGDLLAAHSRTIVRLFADSVRGPTSGVFGELWGYRTGRPLPGSPLIAEEGARTLVDGGCPCVTASERLNSTGAFTFVLPDSWTEGKITLKGVVTRSLLRILPSRTGTLPSTGECALPICSANNHFTLEKVSFIEVPQLVIAPIPLTWAGLAPPPDPSQIFRQALRLLGGADRFVLLPYAMTIDMTTQEGWTLKNAECMKYTSDGECHSHYLLEAVRKWAESNTGFYDLPIGVEGDERAGTVNSINNLPVDHPDKVTLATGALAYSIVRRVRPLTSAGHELGHLLSLNHASACNLKAADLKVPWDTWPPDGKGFIQGVGFDRYHIRLGVRRRLTGAPVDVIAPGAPAQPSAIYDLMSYCASTDELNNPDAWISDRNWNKELFTLNRYGDRVGFGRRFASAGPEAEVGAGASRARTHVTAIVDDAGARITDVTTAARQLRPTPGSQYTLVARDGAGQVLASQSMTVSRGHIDDGGGPFLVLEGDVSKATMVEVRQGSHIVARRIRSVHPPAVRILTPSPINGSRWIPIRWSARDRDGGRLSVVLDYSYDAGKTWRTIFIGPNRGRIRLPTSYFSASHKARIRLRVNDGFNDATAVSAEFTAPGRPPSATIVSPSPATSVLDSSSVYLEGSATDDRLRPIAGSRLAWYAAGRKLGIGPALSVLLPAGRDRVTLVATDSLGRRGSASVFVRVMPTRPAFLRLDAPSRVSPAARHLTLVVAASLRSRLAISGAGVVGARYDVGPVPRSLRVALRPGQRSLGLRLVLSAGGRSTALVVPIAR